MSVVVSLAAIGYIACMVSAWFAQPWPTQIRLKWTAVGFAIAAMIANSAKGETFWAAVWVFNGLCAVIVVYLAYRQREYEADDD